MFLLVNQCTSDLHLRLFLFFLYIYYLLFQYIISIYPVYSVLIGYLLSILNASIFATTTLWLLAENHPISTISLFSEVIYLSRFHKT